MSLKVWLPLNRSLRNQGCANINITAPSGTTLDSTGKIGSCYTTNGSTNGTINTCNLTMSQFSIAAWIRINERVNSWICPFKLIRYTSSSNYEYIGIGCEHDSVYTKIGFHYYKMINGTNTCIFDQYIDAPSVGTWAHFIVTYQGNQVKCYMNGTLVSQNLSLANTATAEITQLVMFGANGSTGTAKTKTSLNDIRIYDHILSDTEIHELSQGLTVHYKLDSVTHGAIDSSGFNNNGDVEGNITTSSDTPRYAASCVFNGTNVRINVPKITLDALTVSFWIKRSTNDSTRQFLYNCWEGVTCELNSSGYTIFATKRDNYPTLVGSIITTSSGWVHFCGTFDTTNGLRLYENGVLKASNTSNLNPIVWNASNSYIGYLSNIYYNGLMSDFRLYATALSADDVLQLYHTGAKMDSKQKLHTFEAVENQSNIKLTKTGRFKAGEFQEASFQSGTPIKFKKTNKIVEVNNLIEY